LPNIIKEIHQLLYAQEKNKYLFFLFLTLVTSIIESFAFLSLAPLIAIILDPNYANQSKILQNLMLIFRSNNNYEFITKYGFFSVAFFIIGSFLNYLITTFHIKFVNKIILNIRLKLLKNYMNKNLYFHKKNSSANLISKLFTQIDETSTSTVFGFFELISKLISLIIFISLLFFVNAKITLISTTILIFFYITVDYRLKRKLNNFSITLYESNVKALKYATETIKLSKEIILENQKKFFLNRFLNELKEIYKIRSYVRIAPRLTRFMIETFAIGGLILFILIIFIRNGNITEFVSVFIYFALAIYKIFPNLNSCFSLIINTKSGFLQLTKIVGDLNFVEKQNISIYDKSTLFKNSIELKNIYFYYEDKKILDNINLKIKKNEKILIYGKSGSGKTTICDIISGHSESSRGQVLFDNKIFTNDRKKYFGYVGQESLILNENYYINISLEKDFNKDRVEQVAKIARLDQFLSNKDCYNEVISENGKNLSGGQKQRISLARALYYNPEIIILDEATSNLDNLTEKEIYSLITKNFSNKTIIIITHRINDYFDFDYCYKIDDGKVVYNGKKLLN
jgi:ABC-type multidrug transport system fused ATPase/permease subunit